VKLDGLYVDPESILAIDFEAGRAPPRRAGPSREADPPEAEGPAVEPAGAGR
jgi:hypothetical protein